MNNIKIGTFNVKGIRNCKKRRKIFQHLHQRQYDIVCLQETYSAQKDEAFWRSTWGGEIIYCHSTTDSRGVMILVRKNHQLKSLNVEQMKQVDGFFVK